MGHNRLGRLPKTHRWRQVIRLLEEGADLSVLADKSFYAASKGLGLVPSDPSFLNTINAIVELAAAAREKDLSGALERVGVDRASQTSSFGLLAAVSQKLSDELSRTAGRSDVGKIAQDSFLESLSRQVRSTTGSLFQDSPEDVGKLTAPLRGNQFKSLMHEFYSAFTSRYLSYYLSRELPNHVGGGGRFADMSAHSEFNRAFDLHCRQTVRIADEFTPGWVGKAQFEGRISRETVRDYAFVAFKKIRSEFERGGN